MYEPLAASIAHRLTAEVATSALPDAPVRREPTSRPRAGARPSLRKRSASLLTALSRRLDPDVEPVAAPPAGG